ncbi:MAG: tetratricopeptide repeat protein, partial [Bryobacteraceae bacterium]
ALFALREALSRHERAAGPQSWEAAVCQDRLAEWYLGEGRYAEAEAALWRVIRIKEALLGPADPTLARHYRRLGELYILQSKYPQADRVLAHAARLALEAPENRTREIGQSLQVLADSQQAQVRPLLAEKLRGVAAQLTRKRMNVELRKEILDALQRVSGYLGWS